MSKRYSHFFYFVGNTFYKNMMKKIDLHCDVLWKMWENKQKNISFTDSPLLDANFTRLNEGEVMVQFFAIFIEDYFPSDLKFQYALEQIDIFHEEILAKHPQMKKITYWSDMETLCDGEIGAVLTLEGADAIGNDLMKLRTLFQLGVKSVGLTWNNANLCADGVGEPRGAGLTSFGAQVVELNNEYDVWTDVSHLSEAAFWDVIKIAKHPVATHSNSKTICPNRRNLTDEQAQALFQQDGLIGIVYTPPFITSREQATIDDLLKHIDHFCALGGKNHIAFGSDFDGIEYYVTDLEHAGKYDQLINELLKHYKEEDVKGFAYKNVLRKIASMKE